MELLKLLCICLIAVVPIVVLKQQRAEFAVVCSVGACVVVAVLLLKKGSESVSLFRAVFDSAPNVSEYFAVALKALGIAHITNFVAETCRDFGQSALAFKAELAGKLAIFSLAVPLLETLLEISTRIAQ